MIPPGKKGVFPASLTITTDAYPVTFKKQSMYQFTYVIGEMDQKHECICNRSRAVCISPRATRFGWTLLFDRKGQFFPSFYSWCGAFDPNVHTITNKLKPACVRTGWGLQETQKVILNTHCTNHSSQGEGDPKRRVPELRVDVTPLIQVQSQTPVPLCLRKKEPQMIVAYTFIWCVKPVMTYTDDARTVSSNIEHHHSPWAWEQLAGNEWWEARYARRPQAYEGHPTKWKI